MFSHIYFGVSDFGRALAFYEPLMAVLGLEQRFCEPDKPWAGWHSALGQRPYFLIGAPYNGEPHAVGNGQMVAFAAQDRRTVERAYAVALAHGGRCEGAPALRPQYHAHYYGAYVRDPDGNKVCVVCNAADVAAAATPTGLDELG